MYGDRKLVCFHIRTQVKFVAKKKLPWVRIKKYKNYILGPTVK